ncbi:MAG: hypothetical protein ACLFPL_02955 [Candidatus Nanoarchaeia archaeon]
MYKYKRHIIILFLITLIIIAGCGGGGKPPKKYIQDLTDEQKEERSIVDSQGNVLFTTSIEESGGFLSDLFIKDDDLLEGYSTIDSFISNQGARVRGPGRISDYYPLNIALLLNNNKQSPEQLYQVAIDSNRPDDIISSYAPAYNYDTSVQNSNNIFTHDFWMSQSGMERLLQFEKENLQISNSWYAIGEKEKEFVIEDERLCVQGGRVISNLLYYRSENSGCYGKSTSNCQAHFNEFPVFKSCSGLSELKESVKVPSDWNSYSLSCNFNSRFSSIPSFFENINMGYSNCVLKNLDESKNSVLFGYAVGNPYIEGQSNALNVSIEELFPQNNIVSQNELSSQNITVRGIEQEAVNLEKSFSGLNGYNNEDGQSTPQFSNNIYNSGRFKITNAALREGYLKSSLTPGHNLYGTIHLGSYQSKVSNNYALVESTREVNTDVERYQVTLENNDEYFVYIIPYTSWYAISTDEIDISDLYNQYSQNSTLPRKSAERIYHTKYENGKQYTLSEESETLKYKSNLFNPTDSYTTSPIYLLKITNSVSEDCDRYFKEYNYEKNDKLSNSNAVSCDVSGGVLHAELNERVFSDQFSPENEWGFGYIVMRNIMYPN